MKQPLADAMRPMRLAGFLGQKHLRSKLAAFAKSLPNLLFFGPPGCGKSTLALLLARQSGKKFARLSAPEASLPQLRRTLEDVEILVLDELHRFTKAQQDFFLPLLESGKLVLLATTTENPSFSVTRQLLSRMHTLRLNPLEKEDLLELAKSGAARLEASIPEESLEMLATASRGDGRALLNLVEYAAGLTKDELAPANLEKMFPEILARHDRAGDSHYEIISALIKSIRGSDVDASLYYLACLLEGGEDPRFICRRLILSASEDIGLANPQALPMAVACQQAVEFTGMPEGFIPLAETVAYLALSRKSNSTYAAYLSASREVKENGVRPVPLHLRNAVTGMQKAWGYGEEYKYPHNFPESWVKQSYLPPELEGRQFYQPRKNGQEPAIAAWHQRKGDSR